MKTISRLGIFDSGLGGYSIYRYLLEKGPNIEYRLYSDQKNAPYGNCPNNYIIDLAKDAMRQFMKWGIYDVLLACNTVSAVALEELKQAFPAMRIWGIIDLTSSQLAPHEKIDVVATQATCRSHAYAQRLEGHLVEERPLPELAGMLEDKVSIDSLDQYLQENLSGLEGDALVLACTHYPIIYDLFERHYPGSIYDSRQPVLDFVQENAFETEKKGSIYTSGSALRMEEQIKSLFGHEERVKEVE